MFRPLQNNACTVFHGAAAWEHASFFVCAGVEAAPRSHGGSAAARGQHVVCCWKGNFRLRLRVRLWEILVLWHGSIWPYENMRFPGSGAAGPEVSVCFLFIDVQQ